MVLKIYNKSKNRTKNRSFFGQFFHENRRFFKVFQRTRPTPSFQIFFPRIRTGSSSIPHFLQRNRTDGSLILELLKEPEPTVLWSWNCWKNQNRWFFDPGILKEWEPKVIWKVKEPSNTRSLSSCLPAWGGDGSHFEREREKREIGEFFVGPDQNCKRMWVWGLREREGWVFASTLGSRKAKWP